MGEVDLKGVKDITRVLLYVEPECDERFPFIVHHPFFSNSISFDGEMFDIFDDIDRARKPYDDMIDRADGLCSLLMLIRDPYKMLWFSMAAPSIGDPEQYADILKDCWVSEEWPNRDVNVDMDWMVRLFRGADRALMVPEWFPESMRVYRGVNMGGSPYGMSWTVVRDIARWFADRFGDDGEVYELEVPRENVLAYIEERGENEVVVDTRGIEHLIQLTD